MKGNKENKKLLATFVKCVTRYWHQLILFSYTPFHPDISQLLSDEAIYTILTVIK